MRCCVRCSRRRSPRPVRVRPIPPGSATGLRRGRPRRPDRRRSPRGCRAGPPRAGCCPPTDALYSRNRPSTESRGASRRSPRTARSSTSASAPARSTLAPARSTNPPSRAPPSTTAPTARNPAASSGPDSSSPDAANATPGPSGPSSAPASRSPPDRRAPSSRMPAPDQIRPRSSRPSTAVRVPSRDGTRQSDSRAPRSLASVSTTGASNRQSSKANGRSNVTAVRSKEPVTRAPRRTSAVRPSAGAAGTPSSSASRTPARTGRLPDGPSRRSTGRPWAQASRTKASSAVRSSDMVPPWAGCRTAAPILTNTSPRAAGPGTLRSGGTGGLRGSGPVPSQQPPVAFTSHCDQR